MNADQAKPEATDFFAAGDYSFWSRILEPASQSLVEVWEFVGMGEDWKKGPYRHSIVDGCSSVGARPNDS